MKRRHIDIWDLVLPLFGYACGVFSACYAFKHGQYLYALVGTVLGAVNGYYYFRNCRWHDEQKRAKP